MRTGDEQEGKLRGSTFAGPSEASRIQRARLYKSAAFYNAGPLSLTDYSPTMSRGGWVRTSMRPVILSTLYKSEGIHLVLLWERDSNHARPNVPSVRAGIWWSNPDSYRDFLPLPACPGAGLARRQAGTIPNSITDPTIALRRVKFGAVEFWVSGGIRTHEYQCCRLIP